MQDDLPGGPAHQRARAASEQPEGAGIFIAIVGPSGAGKDTLIRLAKEAMRGRPAGAETLFVRRVVTRPADADVEDHDTLDEAAFAGAKAAGAFAITWSAHSLSYGLPADVDISIAGGGVVVANVSRAALGEVAERFENLVVVQVTAPRHVLAERLATRGRESREAIMARLARAASAADIPGAVVIENAGAPGDAARRLVAVIEKAAARAALSGLV